MTYKGFEIGIPTLAIVEDYCKKKHLAVPPGQIYKHYSDKQWKNKNGEPISSVEVMCNAWNGVYISHQKHKSSKKIQERARKAEEENSVKEKFQPYDEQLQDPHWKAFREFIFKVRGCSCEICGSKKNLQVHHPKYLENCKAWEYSCKDVIVVCRDCHKKIHGIK